MSFGRNIQGDQVAWWGARAIYQGYRTKYFIDLVWNRQGGDGKVSEAMGFWLNNRALPWLREEVKRQANPGSEEQGQVALANGLPFPPVAPVQKDRKEERDGKRQSPECRDRGRGVRQAHENGPGGCTDGRDREHGRSMENSTAPRGLSHSGARRRRARISSRAWDRRAGSWRPSTPPYVR